MNNKKVGIIGIRGLPAMYGAFDRFVEQFVISNDLKKKNILFYISCDLYYDKFSFDSSNVKRIFVYRGDGLLILLNYLKSILKMYFKGVRCFIFFGYGAAPFFILMKILNCKIICNPDGIEWRRPEKKIKKLYFRFCEMLISKININRIYDSKVIERYYKINHSTKGKTIYYPSVFEKLKIKKKENKSYERFYILGRLLEENNTELIVKVFSKLNNDKKLYIIGKSNNYFEKIIRPYIQKSKNIIFIGPIYDQNKLFKICSLCDYYVHGHSVGGTNPTLIEAINLQKSIIAYKTFFNKEILLENAAYFRNEKQLYNIINSKLHHNIKKPIFRKEFKSDFIFNEYLKYIT